MNNCWQSYQYERGKGSPPAASLLMYSPRTAHPNTKAVLPGESMIPSNVVKVYMAAHDQVGQPRFVDVLFHETSQVR